MDDVLSQNEINALLNAVDSGDVEVEEHKGAELPKDFRSYDLTSNDRIIRGRMPTLDIINERLARYMRASFFNLLRKPVEVVQQQMQLIKFSDWLVTIAVPACLNIFRIPPLRNMCLLAMDANLMFGLVDHLFGGNGGRYRVEGREYSTIELQVIRRVVRDVLDDMQKSWNPIIEINPEFIRTEVNPQFATIASPSDVIINVSFEFEIEASEKGHMDLVIPYSVIEPIRQQLSSAVQTEQDLTDNTWHGIIRETIMGVNVDFLVLLGKGEITVNDLMNLKVGDTLPLDTDANSPLDINIAGINKATGHPVTSRGRLAVKLDEAIGKNMKPVKKPNILIKGQSHERSLSTNAESQDSTGY